MRQRETEAEREREGLQNITVCQWKGGQLQVTHQRFVTNMISNSVAVIISFNHVIMLNAKCGWNGVKLAVTELWSSGNAFSGVMYPASTFGSPPDKSGFGGCQENATCHNA